MKRPAYMRAISIAFLLIGVVALTLAAVVRIPAAYTAAWRCAPETFGASPRNVLANVYNSHRLQVVSRCLTVKGVIARITPVRDGDWHLDLLPDLPYRVLMNARNSGHLILEIVPADQPGCVEGKPLAPIVRHDIGICSGRHVEMPPVGKHVSVSGPYVRDTHHGWMEIHPLWRWNAFGHK